MDEIYEEHRPLVFGLAYRMLGSVAEAEDVVQETFLRYHRASAEERIESPRAWLASVATRISIDQLRSARVRREQYVGQWLPEPLLVDPAPGAAEQAELADTLSLAFLVLLESLSPVERAVFLLREVFGYDYDAIAEIVGKSEENCRQLAVRARRRLEERRPRFEASREQRDELARRFFAAVEDGDTGSLIELLADDVVAVGDGGGKAPAMPQPLTGRVRVARFLAGLGRQAAEMRARIELTTVNGQPGAIARDPDGRVIGVLTIDVSDGRVHAIRSVLNPDKLGHVGPVADARALLKARRQA